MSISKNKHELLYNIKLPEFYQFALDIISEYGYSLYRTVKEIDNARRIELWIYAGDDTRRAMVWLEIVPSDRRLDPYLTTDILRTMNEENTTNLFFFTNGTISPKDREILEGDNQYIFSAEDIIKKLETINEKKAVTVMKKRKDVKTPSGNVLIRNYLKHRDTKSRKVRLKISATPDLAGQYTRVVRRVLKAIDNIEDINSIPSNAREFLKKVQFDLLPELSKTSSYIFPMHFAPLKTILFKLMQHTIVYIGNFTEYESEDSLKANRQIIESLLMQVDTVDEDVLKYKAKLIQQAEKNSLHIILKSGAFCLASLILLIMVKLS